MPDWLGKWRGGRFYQDDQGRRVFVIEAMRAGARYTLKLETHDPDTALGELANFNRDPTAYASTQEAPAAAPRGAVDISEARIALYLATIRKTVLDHRKARRAQLVDWSKLGLDLRTVSRQALRAGLASFEGGHRGRTEALNAFARWLVKEGELPSWSPLVNTHEPTAERAEREAYSLEQLRAAFAKLPAGPVRDVFRLRVSTGMHHTEIEQLAGISLTTGPLPDKGAALRKLGDKHEIRGVLQVIHRKKHKKERRHRQPLDADGLEAALRLRDGVPDRITVWEAMAPLVPSNLRHTFITLAGEFGELVTYTGGGVDRARIAQAVGHRAGSTMTADRYDKLQVPAMIRLPLGF